MGIIKTIVGLIGMVIGILIGYVDYYIISKFYEVSLWISGYVHAPDALAFVITIFLIICFIGLLLIIAIIAIVVFLAGFKIILE
jgi:hypothetical protein